MANFSSERSFFWHDYETFGVQARRDRPAQFAAIRTDLELNQIDEPVEFFCQPSNDYLPNPDACLLTKITPQHCLKHGLPEWQFAAAINQCLSVSGTIGVGYNTLKFDDEVTRFLLWRNLIEPYAREWQNNCGRWDLLNLVRSAWALRPDGIEWPSHSDGKPSFKLEDLAAANGLLHEQAHDALSDVRATIGLARLIRNQQPRLFNFCFALHKKQAVLDEIGNGKRPFLHISGMFSTENGCMAIVFPLAWHPKNKNELIVWNLAHDPAELFTLDAEVIRYRMFTRNDDLPADITRLPIKTIHINQSPIVISNLKTLGANNAERWGINLTQAQIYADNLQNNLPSASLWKDVFAREYTETQDTDEALYSGFVPNNDRRTLERLLTLDAAQLVNSRPIFTDNRLEELFFRYKARNFFDLLNQDERERWQLLCNLRLSAGQEGYLNLSAFNQRLDELEKDNIADLTLLGELRNYAKRLESFSDAS